MYPPALIFHQNTWPIRVCVAISPVKTVIGYKTHSRNIIENEEMEKKKRRTPSEIEDKKARPHIGTGLNGCKIQSNQIGNGRGQAIRSILENILESMGLMALIIDEVCARFERKGDGGRGGGKKREGMKRGK